MVLGEPVVGIFTDGWRFVAEDAARIAERVREQDAGARLVCHEATGELGVAEWYRREHMGPRDIEAEAEVPIQAEGGTWFISLTFDRHGRPFTGAPDARVLAEMRRRDNRNPTRRRMAREYVTLMERRAAEAAVASEQAQVENLLAAGEAVMSAKAHLPRARGRVYLLRGV